MKLPKASDFDRSVLTSKIMAPNPLKLCEGLLADEEIPPGSVVCDLGSGTGITSCMLAREYGLEVYVVDLWSDPEEDRAFFRDMGVSDDVVHPVHADASEGLPFPRRSSTLWSYRAWCATAMTTCPNAFWRPGVPTSWSICTTWIGGVP